MARFVFPSSSRCKLLFLVVCVSAFWCSQPPIALAQRGAAPAGGGAHFGGAGRFAGGAHVIAPRAAVPHPVAPRSTVPPPGRTAVPPFRFSGVRLTGLSRIGRERRPLPGVSGFRVRTRPIRPRPVLPIIPFPIFFGGPFFGYWSGYGFNSLWWPSCNPFWGWGFGCNAAPYGPYYGYGFGGYTLPYVSPYIGPPEYAPPPSYSYSGEETRELPQLYLQDGTVYTVTDYWLVNGQIHFTTLEAGGTKSVEHVIPFEDLDLQHTIDVNTRRGFRFVLRNAPVEEYLRNRDEGNPPAEIAPPE